MSWNNWYHCTITAYGQWLPGDPRGWRTRDHREHVEGDYKNRPRATNFVKGLHSHAQSLMKFPPIRFEPSAREPIGKLILESLSIQKIPLEALAVCPTNIHVLIQSADPRIKTILGKCKQNVTRKFPTPKDQTWWAEESAPKIIKDESHFFNARQYILDHAQKEDAWVWCPESPSSR